MTPIEDPTQATTVTEELSKGRSRCRLQGKRLKQGNGWTSTMEIFFLAWLMGIGEEDEVGNN
jgi:hypothetical protein